MEAEKAAGDDDEDEDEDGGSGGSSASKKCPTGPCDWSAALQAEPTGFECEKEKAEAAYGNARLPPPTTCAPKLPTSTTSTQPADITLTPNAPTGQEGLLLPNS